MPNRNDLTEVEISKFGIIIKICCHLVNEKREAEKKPPKHNNQHAHKRQNMDEFDGRVLICFWRLMYLLLSQQTITPTVLRLQIFSFGFLSLSYPPCNNSHPTAYFPQTALQSQPLIPRCEWSPHPPSITSIVSLKHSIFSTVVNKSQMFRCLNCEVSHIGPKTMTQTSVLEKTAAAANAKHTLITVANIATKKNACFFSRLALTRSLELNGSKKERDRGWETPSINQASPSPSRRIIYLHDGVYLILNFYDKINCCSFIIY